MLSLRILISQILLKVRSKYHSRLYSHRTLFSSRNSNVQQNEKLTSDRGIEDETITEVYFTNSDKDGQKHYSFTNSDKKTVTTEQTLETTEMFGTSVTVGVNVSIETDTHEATFPTLKGFGELSPSDRFTRRDPAHVSGLENWPETNFQYPRPFWATKN